MPSGRGRLQNLQKGVSDVSALHSRCSSATKQHKRKHAWHVEHTFAAAECAWFLGAISGSKAAACNMLRYAVLFSNKTHLGEAKECQR
jgi:hypothetical protein